MAPLFLEEGSTILPDHFTFGEITFILGLLKASYPLMQFFGSPLLGALSDRVGRKKVLSYALVGSIFGYIIFAIGILMDSVLLLFAGRIIDGLTGGNISVIYSSIADISKDNEKTRNFGLVGMAFGVGFIFGPFLGGITSNPEIVSWFNYSTPFWLASILLLINFILVRIWFPETLKTRKESRMNIFSGFQNFAHAFSMKQFRNLFSVIFLMFLGFTFFTQFFDVFLIEKFKFDQSDIGRLFAYIGIWIAVTQGGITRLISYKLSPPQVLRFSLLGVGIFLFALLIPDQSIYLLVVLPFVSLFHGLNQPNLLTLLSNSADEDIQGEVLGINQSLQSLGFTIPPIIAGIIVSFDINLPLIVAGSCMLLAWLIFVLGRKY
ncbi:MAG: tetracycline resistance MFS efflux pump [Bacteroidetes bacterium SW_10_40_5]|nr:MAG: tetracycline resistance MFS efflux pump [Bacteroidetes bacterium SW_10_40_5]